MRNSTIGIFYQALGIIVGIGAVATSAVLEYRLIHINTRSQLDLPYTRAHEIEHVLIAVLGLIAAYVLFRVGRHLKAKPNATAASR